MVTNELTRCTIGTTRSRSIGRTRLVKHRWFRGLFCVSDGCRCLCCWRSHSSWRGISGRCSAGTGGGWGRLVNRGLGGKCALLSEEEALHKRALVPGFRDIENLVKASHVVVESCRSDVADRYWVLNMNMIQWSDKINKPLHLSLLMTHFGPGPLCVTITNNQWKSTASFKCSIRRFSWQQWNKGWIL